MPLESGRIQGVLGVRIPPFGEPPYCRKREKHCRPLSWIRPRVLVKSSFFLCNFCCQISSLKICIIRSRCSESSLHYGPQDPPLRRCYISMYPLSTVTLLSILGQDLLKLYQPETRQAYQLGFPKKYFFLTGYC